MDTVKHCNLKAVIVILGFNYKAHNGLMYQILTQLDYAHSRSKVIHYLANFPWKVPVYLKNLQAIISIFSQICTTQNHKLLADSDRIQQRWKEYKKIFIRTKANEWKMKLG